MSKTGMSRRVSSKRPSRVRDGDEGVCWEKRKTKVFLGRQVMDLPSRKIDDFFTYLPPLLIFDCLRPTRNRINIFTGCWVWGGGELYLCLHSWPIFRQRERKRAKSLHRNTHILLGTALGNTQKGPPLSPTKLNK